MLITLIMFSKRKFYRILESLIKKILRYKNNTNNLTLKKTVRSAIWYTTKENKILFSDINNYKYLLPSCDWISQCMYIEGKFDYSILKNSLRLLGKKNSKTTLVNVGAHIGTTCIPAIKNQNFKNLIAFEPVKKSFRFLKANILLNEIEDKTKIYNLAISNKKTKLHLSARYKNNEASIRVIKKKEKNSETVQSDILDNYTKNLNKNNSLIFIDAEGHEPYILLGAKKTIKKKIPIVMEFFPDFLDKNWIKNFSFAFKNYKFFYILQEKNLKRKFNKENLISLFNEIKLNKNINYKDLLLV